MIDFVGQSEVVLLLTFDDINSEVTITFKNSTETTTLGEMKIEYNRFRPLVEAIGGLGRIYYDDFQPSVQGYKLDLNKNLNKARLVFG